MCFNALDRMSGWLNLMDLVSIEILIISSEAVVLRL